jgi:hypothetical protein
MKHTEALDATWTALTAAMSTDVRFTPDEQAALAAIHVIQDANASTTKEQDMLVVQCMKKYVAQNENY